MAARHWVRSEYAGVGTGKWEQVLEQDCCVSLERNVKGPDHDRYAEQNHNKHCQDAEPYSAHADLLCLAESVAGAARTCSFLPTLRAHLMLDYVPYKPVGCYDYP
jgi:hypothetical protein